MDSMHTLFIHHLSETRPLHPTSSPRHLATSPAPHVQLPAPTTHPSGESQPPTLPSHRCHAVKNLWKNDLLDALQKPVDKKITRMPCKSTYGKKAAHTPMEKGMETMSSSIGFSIGD